MAQIGYHYIRYQNTPLQEKVTWFAGAPGSAVVDPTRDVLGNTGNGYLDSDGQVRTVLQGIGLDWQGVAAQRAGSALQQAAAWSLAAGSAGSVAGSTVGDYGRSFEALRGNVHWEDAGFWDWFNLGTVADVAVEASPLADTFDIQSPMDGLLEQNRTFDAQAVAALQAHEDATRTSLTTFPQVETPPEIISSTGYGDVGAGGGGGTGYGGFGGGRGPGGGVEPGGAGGAGFGPGGGGGVAGLGDAPGGQRGDTGLGGAGPLPEVARFDEAGSSTGGGVGSGSAVVPPGAGGLREPAPTDLAGTGPAGHGGGAGPGSAAGTVAGQQPSAGQGGHPASTAPPPGWLPGSTGAARAPGAGAPPGSGRRVPSGAEFGRRLRSGIPGSGIGDTFGRPRFGGPGEATPGPRPGSTFGRPGGAGFAGGPGGEATAGARPGGAFGRSGPASGFGGWQGGEATAGARPGGAAGGPAVARGASTAHGATPFLGGMGAGAGQDRGERRFKYQLLDEDPFDIPPGPEGVIRGEEQ